MPTGLVNLLLDSGYGFLTAGKTVLGFNYRLVTVAFSLVSDTCHVLATLTYKLTDSLMDISLYILDLFCELLNLGAAIWRVLLKLCFVILHLAVVLMNGLEASAQYVASFLLSGLKLTYQYVCQSSEAICVSFQNVKTATIVSWQWIFSWIPNLYELGCLCGNSIVIYSKNLFNHLGYIIAEIVVGASKAFHVLQEIMVDNIPAPGPFFFGILLGICMISILLLIIKILDQSGISVPTIQIVNVRGVQVQNYRIMDDFDMVVSDEEDGIDRDYDENSRSGRTDDSDLSETEFTDTEAEEFEIDTDTSEDEFHDENNENDQNQINVQLPQRTGRYALRSQQTSLGIISSNADVLSPKELQSFIETENERKLCVICQDLPKNVLVLPCRHMCMCIECAHEMVAQRNRQRRTCPLCRSAIQTVMDVYL